MKESGFAEIAKEFLRQGALTYAGYSAGACVTTPGFEGIELMDGPEIVPEGYPLGGSPPALGWVPWRIVPHWSSGHPESPDADRAVQALLRAELPFRTLRDGHAIVIDDTEERLVGALMTRGERGASDGLELKLGTLESTVSPDGTSAEGAATLLTATLLGPSLPAQGVTLSIAAGRVREYVPAGGVVC